MGQRSIDELCRSLAARIGDEFPQFEGYDLRADAGSAGTVYVALREAKHDTAAGERLADELTEHIEDELAGDDLDFALGLGAGDDDLLLRIELHRPG